MKLYRIRSGIAVVNNGECFLVEEDWDHVVNAENLYQSLSAKIKLLKPDDRVAEWLQSALLAPIKNQEVWAAGVTYLRSREARMDESKSSGASHFYDLVYAADRPELFFKSTAARVAGHGDIVNIRRDSTWNVPEPELTLFINRYGKIAGYTIGNDMSSRSIEGENPLYLPQAKTYERSAALGPCLYVPENPIAPDTIIAMEILRNGAVVYSDQVSISKMKRKHDELAGYLFRECEFPAGCFLMTGTCLVPPDNFTLAVNDRVNIQIEPIGLLTNTVGVRG